ncbi:MAG: zinc finger protein [Candidatus Poseidoniaceae archaeon]
MFKGRVEKVSHEGGLLVSYTGACPALGSVMVDSSETYIGKVDGVIGNLENSLVHVAHLDRKANAQGMVGLEITIRSKKPRDNQRSRDYNHSNDDRRGRNDRRSNDRERRDDRDRGRSRDDRGRGRSRDDRGNNRRQNENHSRNDWDCGECGNSNFSFRTECNRCGAPKGRGGRGPSKQWTGNDRRPGDRNDDPQPRAGDWECRKCKKMNFAKRNECFSCRTPKRVGGPKRKGHHRSHRDPPPLHSAKYGRGRRDDR